MPLVGSDNHQSIAVCSATTLTTASAADSYDGIEGGGVLSSNRDKLRFILPASTKEALFRKVVQATMVRDRQHGPVVELNRLALRRSRASSAPMSSVAAMATVFGQMVDKASLLTDDVLMLPHRTWKVKFVGESVDDCGKNCDRKDPCKQVKITCFY